MFFLIVLFSFRAVPFCIISDFRKLQNWRSKNTTVSRKLSNTWNYSGLILNKFWKIFLFISKKMVLIHGVLNFFFLKCSCYLEMVTQGYLNISFSNKKDILTIGMSIYLDYCFWWKFFFFFFRGWLKIT